VNGGRRTRTAGLAATAVAILVGAPLAGCSSDGDAAPSGSTSTLLPSSSGDACTDVTGDLDLPAGVPADTPGLTGIDFVSAEGTVAGDELDITMTMAGPIDAAPAATYVVAQGEALGQYSFEVRMVHGVDGWSTTLITWPDAVEQRQQVPITPRAEGATLQASVPLASLPPVALAMQFGASASVGDALVIDSCSSLESS
jgi:hypothetical protein